MRLSVAVLRVGTKGSHGGRFGVDVGGREMVRRLGMMPKSNADCEIRQLVDSTHQ
jgi:hypothetical protein